MDDFLLCTEMTILYQLDSQFEKLSQKCYERFNEDTSDFKLPEWHKRKPTNYFMTRTMALSLYFYQDIIYSYRHIFSADMYRDEYNYYHCDIGKKLT